MIGPTIDGVGPEMVITDPAIVETGPDRPPISPSCTTHGAWMTATVHDALPMVHRGGPGLSPRGARRWRSPFNSSK
jgi:hypothetical protein